MTSLYTHSQSLRVPGFLITTHDVHLKKGVSRLHPWLSLSESLCGGQLVMEFSQTSSEKRRYRSSSGLFLSHKFPTLNSTMKEGGGKRERERKDLQIPQSVSWPYSPCLSHRGPDTGVNKYLLSDLINEMKIQHSFYRKTDEDRVNWWQGFCYFPSWVLSSFLTLPEI